MDKTIARILLVLSLTEKVFSYMQSTESYCSMDCRCIKLSIYCFKLPPSSVIFNSVKSEKSVLHIERDDDVLLFLSNKELFFRLFDTIYLSDGKQYNVPSLKFEEATTSIVAVSTQTMTSSESESRLIHNSDAATTSVAIGSELMPGTERVPKVFTSSTERMHASTYSEKTIKHITTESTDRYRMTDTTLRIESTQRSTEYSDYDITASTLIVYTVDGKEDNYSIFKQSIYKLLFYSVSSVLLCLVLVLVMSILIRKWVRRNRFERLVLDESRHDLELQEIGADAVAHDSEL
jgi:hypothetical protein